MSKVIDDALLALMEREEELKRELSELQQAIKTLEGLGNFSKAVPTLFPSAIPLSVEEKQEIRTLVEKKEPKKKQKHYTGRTKAIMDVVVLHPGLERKEIVKMVVLPGEETYNYSSNYGCLTSLITDTKQLKLVDGKVYLATTVEDNKLDPNYQPNIREKMILAELKNKGGKATISTITYSLSKGQQPYMHDYRDEMFSMVKKGLLYKEGQFVRMK